MTLVLEPPSNYSKDMNAEIEAKKTKLNEEEYAVVKKIKKREREKVVHSSSAASLLHGMLQYK